MKPYRFSPVLVICLVSQAFALDPNVPGSVFVRVVDVGSGLCCVVKMPGPRYLIYDAGNYDDGGESVKTPERTVIWAASVRRTECRSLAIQAILSKKMPLLIMNPGMQSSLCTWA